MRINLQVILLPSPIILKVILPKMMYKVRGRRKKENDGRITFEVYFLIINTSPTRAIVGMTNLTVLEPRPILTVR